MSLETAQSHNEASEARPWEEKRSWRWGILLVAILLVFYSALQNGLWVPVSDGDIYLAMARNIATGKGFTFNGLPVRATPPGWPIFLSWMMRISPSFRFLNLVPMCLVVLAMFLYYRVLLRLTTAPRAFAVCLATGMLSHVFHRTFQFHSEGLFCVVVAGALLLAVQANERPSGLWRLALVIVLCALIVLVRWAGVLLAPLIAGALLAGRIRPRVDKLWIGALLATLVLVGVFVGLRRSQDEAEPVIRQATGARSYAANKHPIAQRLLSVSSRIPRIGIWYAAFLAEPVRLGQSIKFIDLIAGIIGFGLLAMLIWGIIPSLRRRQWMTLAALLYSLGIAAIWNTVTGRYFVPVAPFLMLALWEGAERLGQIGSSPIWPKLSKSIIVLVLLGAASCSLALYAVNVWLLHSDDFYGTYYAGQPKDLIAVAEALKARSVKDGEVARSDARPRWDAGSPSLGVLFELRGLSVLINRTILSAPRKLYSARPNDETLAWARQNGVLYYIHVPPPNPWRVWHFRTPWLQEWRTGKPVGEPTPFFELYEVAEEGFVRIPLPETDTVIDRMPGL